MQFIFVNNLMSVSFFFQKFENVNLNLSIFTLINVICFKINFMFLIF